MEVYIGQIIPWASNRIPRGFFPCDGRILSVNQYSALYSIIGNTYGGSGNSFALPDLRGRAVLGAGQLPGGTNFTAGAMGGSEKVALTLSQVPPHGHLVCANGNPGAASATTGTGNLFGAPGNNAKMYHLGQIDTVLHPNTVTITGEGQPHENMQPYQVINYLICVDGMYPPKV